MSDIYQDSLAYHRAGKPGKISVEPTKQLETQRDLSLAYSPGVAEPVRAIAADPSAAYEYTAKGNLVAVISNGTAILGLGNLGALASKPVMEGKAVLFKKFAGIDAIDLELASEDPQQLISAIRLLAPTFAGINLEDIKAPDCFVIEQALQDLGIPVFHDDQHGTAVVTSAGLLNALHLTGRDVSTTSVVINGAGSAGIAIGNMLRALGFEKNHILMCDTKGVIFEGRTDGMNAYKQPFVVETSRRTLKDAVEGADVFIGVSKAGALTPEMLLSMAKNPIVFALANPDPEIPYQMARETRSDVIIATGRSDNPNQVNNVLCFPFLFRGALDTRATSINQAMKIAAVHALAGLAREQVPQSVLAIYGLQSLSFGPDYMLPKPFDPRLLATISPAVAKASMESGAAQVNVDLAAYVTRLFR